MWKTQDRKEGETLYLSLSFLQGLASGSLFNTLADFHEAGRKSPETGLGFDSAPAEEYVAVPFRNAACDDLGIVVMNGPTGLADKPRQVVAVGNFLRNWSTASAAIVHNEDVSRETYYVKRGANNASRTMMQ